ncbi:MAG TPA: type II toxin-antitoxin system HicA family toxin [Armatimonadota bacterium]|jgi:predicted RNA binding protein YcfA (HicA-like mRNA interferase family)
MTRLPAVRPERAIGVLLKMGYIIDHQTGSHVILYKEAHIPITVPRHNRELKRGTLHHILQSAGLSVDEFIRLLR